VACVILALALSIDLTFFLAKVLLVISQWSSFWPFYLIWYLGLRATDFLTDLAPLICFGGVFWAEITHTTSRERLVVWLSGRSIRRCLVPALIFGVAVGAIEVTLNLYLRPTAVMTMASNHLGFYGEHLDPRPQLDPQWFAAGNDLIQATVEPGTPPALHDIRVYRMDDSLALRSVFRAKIAKPLDDHVWLLSDGTRWSVTNLLDGSNTQKDTFVASDHEEAFAKLSLNLDLPAVWLNNSQTAPRYLPNKTFLEILKGAMHSDSDFRTWRQARFSLPIFCITMPIIAAILSIRFMSSGVALSTVCLIALMGYLANTAMKVFVLLGEHGYLAPLVASWSVPTVVAFICAAAATLGGRTKTCSVLNSAESRAVNSPAKAVAYRASLTDDTALQRQDYQS
jgi:lipopolysaccharide export LptBFGC system permease protein LptF